MASPLPLPSNNNRLFIFIYFLFCLFIFPFSLVAQKNKAKYIIYTRSLYKKDLIFIFSNFSFFDGKIFSPCLASAWALQRDEMHLYLARCVEWASPVLPDNRLLPPPPLRRRGKVTTVFCSFGSITFFRKALYIYTNAERKERKKKTLSASTVLNVERQLGSRWLLSQSKIKKGFDLLFFGVARL